MHKSEKGKFEEVWRDAFEGAELAPSEGHWDVIELKLSLAGRLQSNFERGWRKTFKNAELSPSEEVWKAIDVALVQSENAGMRKSIAFYQRIAAAAVGILIMFGAYSWLAGDFSQQNNVTGEAKQTPESGSPNANQNSSESPSLASKQSDSVDANLNVGTDKNSSINKSSPTSAVNVRPLANSTTPVSDSNSLMALTTESNSSKLSSIQNSNTATSLLEKKNLIFNQGPISELALLDVSRLPNFFGPNDYSIAYRLADARPAVISKNKKGIVDESKWAAVGFSAGTFSPGVGGGEMMESTTPRSNTLTYGTLAADQTSTPKSESVKSGSSMTFMLSAGKRIFRKWILQGGLSYLNQSSIAESSTISAAPANQIFDAKVNSFTPEATNTVTYSTQEEINSSYQFLSVPVQVGYMLVDRKFGIQINGGVSPDVFLKNSVYNQTTQVETTNTASNNGTFNSVSLSGLGGVEFSYRFLDHYRLSLTPGVRYSLTAINNDSSLATAKPFVADIGLRFRYIF